MFKRIFFVLLIFNLPRFLMAQDDIQNNIQHAKEIFETYNLLESKFKSVVKERLLYFLNEDTILKKNFLEGDSINFKKLEIIIYPILKFKKEALEFTYKQDIFDLIEFDTIDFHCVAQFFLCDSLCFLVTRGHNDCDIEPLNPCGCKTDWCPGDYYFQQTFYHKKIKYNCFNYNFNFPNKKDSSFLFFIDCFSITFILIDKRIHVYSDDQKPWMKFVELLDKPIQFIREIDKEKWIRHCAKKCPAGGYKPWWKFW